MNQNLLAFRRVLDPEDNQTGGGAASAVAGAMAAALVGMVARLSIGRKGMETETFYQEIDRQAQDLSATLLSGAQIDSQAFDEVMAAYRKPKDTAEQKAVRTRAIQTALIHATQVPLTNADCCAQALALGGQLIGRSNPNAASDLACAQYLGYAALMGCLSNIEVNVAMIKDETTQRELTARHVALSNQAAQWR